jgi:Gluconate 2-dehydrogenase subunit 3
MNDNPSRRMDRREALKWVGAAIVAYPLLQFPSFGAVSSGARRTLSDPDLFNPGKLWDRVLTPQELATVAALCDTIIPEDEKSPCASKVGVPDFIDEWVSAPYPIQQADQKQIREGLAWLDTEAKKRFEKEFAALTADRKTKICDDICYLPKAKPEFEVAAKFFARFRDLTASGFYTTKEGMDDLQYKGNIPQATFNGPPKKVLEYLKLA